MSRDQAVDYALFQEAIKGKVSAAKERDRRRRERPCGDGDNGIDGVLVEGQAALDRYIQQQLKPLEANADEAEDQSHLKGRSQGFCPRVQKMTELSAAYWAALHLDFIVFYEMCFALLEPGTEFHDNWHIHAIAEALRRVELGEVLRLIINVPPRSGKSTLVSVAFTAWLLGHNPKLKIICVSYSESLAKTLPLRSVPIVKSDWYRRAFPVFQIAHGGDRSVETITTQHGFRYAVSIAGPVMGRDADIIIADDALSPDAAFSEAVRIRQLKLWDTAHRTRLNDKQRGAIISVSQRLHQHDLVGHLLSSGR